MAKLEDHGASASRIPTEDAAVVLPMLDRVMRAVNDRAGWTEYGPIIPASLLEPIARAALGAVREPSAEMVVAAFWNRNDVAEWRRGIDAIREGK